MITVNEWCERWSLPLRAIAELTFCPVEQPAGGVLHSESHNQSLIRLAAVARGCILFRNNSGVLSDDNGRPVRFGLGNDSAAINKSFKSADLIGLAADGRFLAVEVKRSNWNGPSGEHELAQAKFLALVRARGGLAGFARSVEEFHEIIG